MPAVSMPLTHCHHCLLPRRILEAVAEDQAIDDTIYALDKALQQGKIQLQVYLKVPFAALSLAATNIAHTFLDCAQVGARPIFRAGADDQAS